MWNARLDESLAGIKTAVRNINNPRYADDSTIMAESEEELKSLLMKVKEESEKVGLKLIIQKTKIMTSGPITSWQIDGETNGNSERLYFGGYPCFVHDPTNVGNLISGSSAFSKSSLNIWKFSVHLLLKPSLEDFEHYFASMWNEGNSMVVWTFFGIAFLLLLLSLQSCPTLCNPINGSPSGSPVPGILQARTLEWVAIAFLKLE